MVAANQYLRIRWSLLERGHAVVQKRAVELIVVVETEIKDWANMAYNYINAHDTIKIE